MTVGSQLKQTIAGLHGIQGTFRLYAAQARHDRTRFAFREACKVMDDILIDLEGRMHSLEFTEPQYKGL